MATLVGVHSVGQVVTHAQIGEKAIAIEGSSMAVLIKTPLALLFKKLGMMDRAPSDVKLREIVRHYRSVHGFRQIDRCIRIEAFNFALMLAAAGFSPIWKRVVRLGKTPFKPP